MQGTSLVALVVQLLSHVQLFATPWTAACQPPLYSTISRNLLKLMSIESVMPLTSSSSATPFSFCLLSFPSSGSFPVSQLFTSDGQNTEASTSMSVLLMNIQGWFPLGLTGLISLQSKGCSKSSPTPQFKNIYSLVLSLLYGPSLTSIQEYWKNLSLD